MCTICIFAYVILSVRAIDGMEHIIRPAKDIRELVDSLCKDGADAQYIQYLSKSRILSPQMLKANLSTQPSSLSTFMISKTDRVSQKPRRRQLNAKVCGSKSSIFCISSIFVQTTCQTMITRKWLKYSS